ncbi:MAG: hypothetical protein Kow00105_07740 [Phycisphaeraceae bacterium]
MAYNGDMSDTEQATTDTSLETDSPEKASDASPSSAPPELTPEQEQELDLKLEAALLTTDRPMTAGKLGELLDGVGAKAIQASADRLNRVYEETNRSFRIEKVAGGLQILTLPRYAHVLSALHKTRAQAKLSPAAMETLAIIAYQQPIMRAQIENIRGVACGEVLRSLMERKLVKIVGRAEEIGRPMLYGTTKTFLEVFGLSSLKDLPKVEKSKPPQL